MQPYRLETTVSEQGTLIIKGVPFPAGEHVEVIIREIESVSTDSLRYPLRGTPYELHQPFESVAEEEWEVLQ